MNPGLVIPIVGMMIPIIIVPISLLLKHARLERELEHAERMKALELGRTLPQDESWWSPARTCVLLGAGVPLGVFLGAWGITESLGVHDVIWYAAGLIGTTGVIGGTILAGRQLRNRVEGDPCAKPAPLADAHDFTDQPRTASDGLTRQYQQQHQG